MADAEQNSRALTGTFRDMAYPIAQPWAKRQLRLDQKIEALERENTDLKRRLKNTKATVRRRDSRIAQLAAKVTGRGRREVDGHIIHVADVVIPKAGMMSPTVLDQWISALLDLASKSLDGSTRLLDILLTRNGLQQGGGPPQSTEAEPGELDSGYADQAVKDWEDMLSGNGGPEDMS